MYLIVASKEDNASMNIQRALIEDTEPEEVGTFDGNPVLSLPCKALLVTIDTIHLETNYIDKSVSKAFGIPNPDVIIFLSRHKSESGLRTLTVHPIGCYGTADYGGREKNLVPSAPFPMANALRSIHRQVIDKGLDFKVCYECTHHGPYLGTPSFFIEIGSSVDAWDLRAPAEILATAVQEVLAHNPRGGHPVVIGVGGGHYAPRFTEVALKRKVSFGHMVPNYALNGLTQDVMDQIVNRTPEAKFVYFHRKSMKGPQYRDLKERFVSLGLEAVRERDLEEM